MGNSAAVQARLGPNLLLGEMVSMNSISYDDTDHGLPAVPALPLTVRLVVLPIL